MPQLPFSARTSTQSIAERGDSLRPNAQESDCGCVVSFPPNGNYFNVFHCFLGHVIFRFWQFGHEILSFPLYSFAFLVLLWSCV